MQQMNASYRRRIGCELSVHPARLEPKSLKDYLGEYVSRAANSNRLYSNLAMWCQQNPVCLSIVVIPRGIHFISQSHSIQHPASSIRTAALTSCLRTKDGEILLREIPAHRISVPQDTPRRSNAASVDVSRGRVMELSSSYVSYSNLASMLIDQVLVNLRMSRRTNVVQNNRDENGEAAATEFMTCNLVPVAQDGFFSLCSRCSALDL
ncbi:uncharacterized protein F4812DRAFT_424667 [Daldinia caldariorum]|uniref:uncharacterized protein n=1 Tax=Daldinia caldariorum TaxID=326644 RepID=UPI00200839A9|nr:uncharacterized protein F4812DRAFT_424667 [Daldinia caldariorum]KAI1468772.1 hypothetical protein F4812DRAFT_424667 [Daldinia caldariorum]